MPCNQCRSLDSHVRAPSPVWRRKITLRRLTQRRGQWSLTRSNLACTQPTPSSGSSSCQCLVGLSSSFRCRHISFLLPITLLHCSGIPSVAGTRLLRCVPPLPSSSTCLSCSLRPSLLRPPFFCREVRRHRIANPKPDKQDKVVATLKRAADALRESHPYRVHDLESAKRVHCCGPWMAQVGRVAGPANRLTAALAAAAGWAAAAVHARQPCTPSHATYPLFLLPRLSQIIVDTLFAAYPPEPPGEEELEELALQEAAAKRAAVRGPGLVVGARAPWNQHHG